MGLKCQLLRERDVKAASEARLRLYVNCSPEQRYDFSGNIKAYAVPWHVSVADPEKGFKNMNYLIRWYPDAFIGDFYDEGMISKMQTAGNRLS